MGVRRSDWIVIGVDIGVEHFNGEWYEMDNSPLGIYDENTTPGEITYLYDGMCGEYFIIGEVIKCDSEGDNGLGFFEYRAAIDTDYLKSIEKVKSHVKDIFKIDNADVNLIILTHWT